MRMLTMERIEQLDGTHGAQIRDFVRHIRLATVFHEDNHALFSVLAERFGVGIEEFSAYVWLQVYAQELRGSYDDVPSLGVVAQQFGLSLVELDAYIGGRDDVMTAEEYRDYLLDLQQDAGI